MDCVSSTLLNQDDEFSQIGVSSALSHHIFSLTSTTYGLLTLDPPPPPSDSTTTTTTLPPIPTLSPEPPPPRRTLGSLFPSLLSEPRSLRYQPLETINSWDLMSGLDSDHIPSFRFSPSPFVLSKDNDENVSPNVGNASSQSSLSNKDLNSFLQGFEMICPPNGENKVVMFTTTLRGVRKTFEDCNAVRSAFQGLGIFVCERDISMYRGFRDELRELLKGKGSNRLIPPRLFVKGRYIGGVDEVTRIVEEGYIGKLLQDLPKSRGGYVCEGCGGVGFLPCFTCHGSCKTVVKEESDVGTKRGNKKSVVVVRCSECNENGLVLCPICS